MFNPLQTAVSWSNIIGGSEYVFEDCHSLQSIVIPEGVVYIGENAFKDCYILRDVVIPDSVKYIGEDAFINGAINKLTIHGVPGSVAEEYVRRRRETEDLGFISIGG